MLITLLALSLSAGPIQPPPSTVVLPPVTVEPAKSKSCPCKPCECDPCECKPKPKSPSRRPIPLPPVLTTPKVGPESTCPDPTPAAVKIRCGNGVGSGTVVACENGKSLVLTAAHVAQADTCQVCVHDRCHAGRVLARDQWSDLALVVVEAKLAVAVIADAVPKDGAEVMQYGYTYGSKLRKSKGKVLKWDGAKVAEGTAVFGTSAATDSGDSGCGAFVAGELVAVVARKDSPTPYQPGAGRCVHLADVRRFVRDSCKTLFPKLHKTLCATDVYPPGWVGDKPMHGGPVAPMPPRVMPYPARPFGGAWCAPRR